MAAFWPGPLTLLLPPHPRVPAALLGDSDCIGVRWPASTLSQQLAVGLGGAITASRKLNVPIGHVLAYLAGNVMVSLLTFFSMKRFYPGKLHFDKPDGE